MREQRHTDQKNFPLTIQRLVAGFAIVLGVCATALSAIYEIDNPAAQIKNPASKMYNPASNVDNPSSKIYNPAANMNNPSPVSPVTQPVPQPEETKSASRPQKRSLPPLTRPAIPQKRYNYKTVKQYLKAAKKAFITDNYMEFLMITEDAVRRIDGGTLKASNKEKVRLKKYKTFGYGLVE